MVVLTKKRLTMHDYLKKYPKKENFWNVVYTLIQIRMTKKLLAAFFVSFLSRPTLPVASFFAVRLFFISNDSGSMVFRRVFFIPSLRHKHTPVTNN
mmetsp:Transcript_33907/g.34146  ORF Transcript_33907/g.34146 Transcript_33907/m.34146 type:complete len:96 (-) Transcript_33907:31-318(-)